MARTRPRVGLRNALLGLQAGRTAASAYLSSTCPGTIRHVELRLCLCRLDRRAEGVDVVSAVLAAAVDEERRGACHSAGAGRVYVFGHPCGAEGSRPGISEMAAHPLSQVARITHGRPTARPRLRLTRSSAVLIPQPRSMLSRVHEARSRFSSALVTNSFRAVSHVSRCGEFRCNNHWPFYSSPFTPVRARPRIRQAMASPGSSRRREVPVAGSVGDRSPRLE
jgi:hypothetical protein